MRGISDWFPCQMFCLLLSQQFDFSWSSVVEAKLRCSSSLKPSDAGQTEHLPVSGEFTALSETSETSAVLPDKREGASSLPSPLSKSAAPSAPWIPSPGCISCTFFPSYLLGTSATHSHCPKTLLGLWQTPLILVLGSFTQQLLTMLSQGKTSSHHLLWYLQCYFSI